VPRDDHQPPHSWQPVDLAALGERPPVAFVGDVDLVYRGSRALFSGPPESGKTLAAYCIALLEIRTGGAVVLIDLEMGRYDARDRLRDLGATDDELAAIRYYEPDRPADADTVAELAAGGPSLAILDAAAGLLSLQGLDDNKRADVEAFARTFVQPLRNAGVATLTIDHVTKTAETRGGFAIGSERKVGAVDVHLGFEAIHKLSRGGHGLYRITTHKDRLGHLPRPRAGELELTSDPDTGRIDWTFRPATLNDEHDDNGAGFKPTVLMQRVVDHLRDHGEPLSRSAIAGASLGRRQWVFKAIDILVNEGTLVEHPDRKLTLPEQFPVPGTVPGTTTGVGTDTGSHLLHREPGTGPTVTSTPNTQPRS